MNDIPSAFLGALSPAGFLAEYWQKKPLLVRQAIPGFVSPVTPDQFLSLACREDALTRLIVEKGGAYPWELREGPFNRRDLDTAPGEVWSMLIQEMDRMVPEVHDLWRHVSFLPNWRLDDIMVSLATSGGGVGAHIDNYDVFLLQAHGRRRWQIGLSPRHDEELIPDLDVSILAEFEPQAEWILEPGDMLYLPPRFAHYGVALDTCMTYSFGCRAPSAVEIMGALFEQALEDTDPDLRYADPDLKPVQHTGMMDDAPAAFARALLSDVGLRAERTLGRVLTEPRRYVEMPPGQDQDIQRALQSGARLYCPSPGQGLYRMSQDGSTVLLFIRGEVFELHPSLVNFATALTSVGGAGDGDIPDTDTGLLDLLEELVAEGALLLR